jgi:hypothetical protein
MVVLVTQEFPEEAADGALQVTEGTWASWGS